MLTARTLPTILTGSETSLRDFAVSAFHKQQWSMRTHDWAYLMPLTESTAPQLYDRRTDLIEQHNVLEQHREVAENLETELRGFADSVAAP